MFVVENFKKLRKKWNFEPKICLHVVLTLYYQPMQTEILKIDESQDIVVLKSKVRPLIHPLWLLCCSPILMEAKSVWMIWSKIMIQNLKKSYIQNLYQHFHLISFPNSDKNFRLPYPWPSFDFQKSWPETSSARMGSFVPSALMISPLTTCLWPSFDFEKKFSVWVGWSWLLGDFPAWMAQFCTTALAH